MIDSKDTLTNEEREANDMLQKYPELVSVAEQIDSIIDKTYNLAIIHFIGIAKTYFMQLPELYEPLVIKLEALKKKP